MLLERGLFGKAEIEHQYFVVTQTAVELQRGIGPEHGEKMIERRGVDKIFKGNLLAAVRVGEFTLSIHTGKRTAKANLR